MQVSLIRSTSMLSEVAVLGLKVLLQPAIFRDHRQLEISRSRFLNSFMIFLSFLSGSNLSPTVNLP